MILLINIIINYFLIIYNKKIILTIKNIKFVRIIYWYIIIKDIENWEKLYIIKSR